MKKAVLFLIINFSLLSICLSQHRISGYITYDNNKNTPFIYTKVFITDTMGKPVDSTTTDLNGFYLFKNIPDGKYKTEVIIKYSWGGIYPTDALIVNRNYIGVYKITDPLKLLAADVNIDKKRNPTDALLINRRYIKVINSFKAGDWLIDDNIVILKGQDITKNIKLICTGDIDGSYTPAYSMYYLNFAGSGASTKVDSVYIENITQCTTTKIKGSDTLVLDIIPAKKFSQSLIQMNYHKGDMLKITGISGIYKTVVMLIPASSQTVTFNFYACTDIDGNNYAIVKIGSRIWMEENLKTTKYRDGSNIPYVADSATWGKLTTGAYCDFHNLPEEGIQYGHFYNYYVVSDNRGICPDGWHVPAHTEWNRMEKFLDPTADTTALMGRGKTIGRILKEGCKTRWQYMDSTSGWNSAGFTALCSNFRSASGAWSRAPENNHDNSFWSSTSYNTKQAWNRSLRWCFSDIYVIFIYKTAGSSIRCIKDQ